MKELQINSGSLHLTSDDEITLDDISTLAQRAIDANIPGDATITYITVNYSPTPSTQWEVRIAWQWPRIKGSIK